MPKYPAATKGISIGFCPCFVDLIAITVHAAKNGLSRLATYIDREPKLMETDTRLPSGEWNGFYLEDQRSNKGWMHLYLKFEDGKIAGEGTDYVGPWVASGSYDLDSGKCGWVKEYVGQHNVRYAGVVSDKGIMGEWTIFTSGPFHIWPRGMNHMHENYLKQELNMPMPMPALPSGGVMEPVEI